MKYLLVTLLVVLSLSSLALADNCDVGYAERMDCGFSGMNPADCTGKGCCWVPASVLQKELFMRMLKGEKVTKQDIPSNDTPWCFYPSDSTVC